MLPNSGQQVGGRTFFKSKHPFHELIIVECGIGKVNSAMVSTILIQQFKCETLIFSGIAGGIDPDMKIGEVLIGEFLIQYDYGVLKDGNIRTDLRTDIRTCVRASVRPSSVVCSR